MKRADQKAMGLLLWLCRLSDREITTINSVNKAGLCSSGIKNSGVSNLHKWIKASENTENQQFWIEYRSLSESIINNSTWCSYVRKIQYILCLQHKTQHIQTAIFKHGHICKQHDYTKGKTKKLLSVSPLMRSC